MNTNEKEILEAALLGYQSQVSELQGKMREIEERLHPAIDIIAAWTKGDSSVVLKRRRTFSDSPGAGAGGGNDPRESGTTVELTTLHGHGFRLVKLGLRA